ncbi:hypothetical protein C2E23DRAFT_822506 [Lenzites betulinus]|nr:hypothetical protein C2E23DRAFT_822506 [Lenzites betulinus]
MSVPPDSDTANGPVRRPSTTSRSSNSVPFPAANSENVLKESGSSSSALTSSDKLSALPTQSPPVFERLRTPSRAIRRSTDASASLTSLDGPSGSWPALQSFASAPAVGPTRLSESDSSFGRETPRQRNESERSLPTTLHNIKQAEPARLNSHSCNDQGTLRSTAWLSYVAQPFTLRHGAGDSLVYNDCLSL